MERTFSSRYTLTLEDYEALSKAYARLTPGRRAARVIHAIVDVLLFVLAAFYWQQGEAHLALYFFALALFILLLRLVVEPWQRRRAFKHQRLGEFEITFDATEEGFSARSTVSDGNNKWASIRQVDDVPEHVFLWPSNRLGFVVPKRGFATAEVAQDFVRLAKEKTADQKL